MRVYIWMSTRASNIYYSMNFGEVRINSHMNMYLEGHQDFGQAFYSDLSWDSPSVLRTLNYAKELDLSDPRDRIYAFMDLLRSSEKHFRIEPDYRTSHLDIYRQFALRYIQAAGDTELLDYVSHNKASLSSGIPSWVPRWDITTWSLGQSSTAASALTSRKSSTVEPKIIENGSFGLRIRGVIIDTVRFVSDVFDWENTTAESIRRIWDRVSAERTSCPYIVSTSSEETENYQLDAFLDSLSAGTYDGEYSEWRAAIQLFKHDTRLRQDDDLASDHAETGASEDSNVFLEHIRNRSHNKRFVLTNRGYMGLAPIPTQNGDTCGIIFGCRTPCILREACQHGTYAFVGATALMGKECYDAPGGGVMFCKMLGEEDSKDWVEWDVEEQDITLV
jgi:hypothetical protein